MLAVLVVFFLSSATGGAFNTITVRVTVSSASTFGASGRTAET